MDFQLILGVDMSKEWFDYCLMESANTVLQQDRVDNQEQAIAAFLADLSVKLAKLGYSLSQVRLCLEYTGIYVKPLQRAWMMQGAALSMIPASHISEGLNGGQKWAEKTDALDAGRIAEYGWRFADRLTVWQAESQTLQQLRLLQRQRERLLACLHALLVPLREMEQLEKPALVEQVRQSQQRATQSLQADLKALQQLIEQTIQSDAHLQQLYEWMLSVQGIGPATAREILLVTHGFTRFQPHQAKSFARYAGIVPGKKESGKQRSKARLRKKGNKQIKCLLTMGARSVSKSNSELGQYYRRKIAEGKPHKCVINALRNKIILRVFAVVRNQVMYQKNLNHSLVLP